MGHTHTPSFSQRYHTLSHNTMPALKLTYFDLRARAEPARLLLAQAGADYEDNRLPAPFDDAGRAAWAAAKPTYPFGVLPNLQVDGGASISQSMTIARYVAHTHGLAGATPLANAQMDEIVDAVFEAGDKQYAAYLFEKDATRKAELQKAYADTVVPTVLGHIEKRLVERGGDWLVGDKVSWADILLYNYTAELPDKSLVAPHPKVAALVARVADLPNIKKWVETRPVTSI